MPSGPKEVLPFHHALRDMMRWLQDAKVDGMIIGGVAVALIGRVRMTRDLDLVVWVEAEAWSDFLRRGEKFGFVSRFSDPIEFAERNRIFAVRHAPSKITVDLSLAGLELEHEMIQAAQAIEIDDLVLPVATPEDLIVMKAYAERDQDLRDVEGLVVKHSPLNRKYLNKRAKQMELALELPGFAKRVEQLTKRKKR
jgi:predicted nucleotidyltransferase